MRAHKHSGVIKNHLINQQHKKIDTQNAHNFKLKQSERSTFWQGPPGIIKEVMNKPEVSFLTPDVPKVPVISPISKNDSNKEYVIVSVDSDGFINIDLNSSQQKGIRILLGQDGDNKRQVLTLQINK